MKRAFPKRGLLGSVLGLGAILGCGSNNTSVPPELLRAIEKGGNQQGYPKGPYGTSEGDTAQNLCFEGWRDPAAAGYDTSRFERICFSDFYDAGGTKIKLLLVNSSAVWCTACRFEYGGSGDRPPLSQRLADRQAEGFRILGTLFQDSAGNPATPDDTALWARTFKVDFPFVRDQDHQMGLFTTSNIAPFNMLLDTRTMKLVLELSGDEPALLFTTVDDFLAGGTGQ